MDGDRRLVEFATLVRQMREAQRAYFAGRPRSRPRKAQEFEREVDQVCAVLLTGAAGVHADLPGQKTLFQEDTPGER